MRLEWRGRTLVITWLPVETAEMSAAAPNLPTTCKSTFNNSFETIWSHKIST